jgi:3-dehydroquinate dehydratase type I
MDLAAPTNNDRTAIHSHSGIGLGMDEEEQRLAEYCNVIDADQHFFQSTGLSRAAFNAKHGVKEYRRRELEVMNSILLDNRFRCVITCGPGSVEGKGQGLLREYARTHPVIYVLRDTEDIQRYLRAWDTETVSNLVKLTGPSYRASSSFEFYNISESAVSGTQNVQDPHEAPLSLTLKNLQQDFLQLIYNITNQTSRHAEREVRPTVSLLPPESRQFTYALSLPLSALTSIGAEIRNMESTSDVVEFVVDVPILTNGGRTFDNDVANNISKHFYSIRRYTQIPIIFQVPFTPKAPTATSAELDELEEAYFELLHFGLRLAPEYLSVDITCNEQRFRKVLGCKGSTKIIGHFFDPAPGSNGWTAQDRKEKLRRAEELGSDIVRLCQEAVSMADNTAVYRFAHEIKSSDQPHRPLIAYNTSSLGRMSCWLNPTLTPVTHTLLRSARSKATPDYLLTIPEAQNALYASFTLDRMCFGIVGSNVLSSLSPAMYNAAFQFCGMPHEYKPFQHAVLEDVESILHDRCFGGASITAPFKAEIMRLVEFMSPEARAIGAVNSLIPLRSKNLESLLERSRTGPIVAFYGENTDWIGIHTCISRNLSPVNTVNEHTTGLILGAGGMSRAAVYAMIRLGVRAIFLHNRTVENATEVAAHFNHLSSQENRGLTNLSNSDWDLFFEKLANGTDHFIRRPTVRVLQSLNNPWPAGTDPPTIVVSSLPGRNPGNDSPIDNTIPANWLTSQTGGVVVEVCTAH